MSREMATTLFESGIGHAQSAQLLYEASFKKAESDGVEDPRHFAFNGPYSLSVYYLLGLSIELLLKAAFVQWSGVTNEKGLRDIGHDLTRAIDAAEGVGFVSSVPNLRKVIGVLNGPYKAHWFRYLRPDKIPLPDFNQVIITITSLADELEAKISS